MEKRKILIIAGVIILLISVPLGIFLIKGNLRFQLGAQNANQPENVRISSVTEQTATITWTTKTPAQGLVSYGLSASNLTLIQPETAPAINHQLTLTGLMSGSNYFFVIKIGGKTYDNNGQPYTLTTQTKAAPKPTSAPQPAISEKDLEAAMGTNNPTYDLNKDGLINTLDLLLFRQQTK